MMTLSLRAQSEAHWTLNFKSSRGLVNLHRQAFGLAVVLDAERHLVLVMDIQNPRIKRLVCGIGIWFQSSDVGTVDIRPHCVANGIMTIDAGSITNVSDQEVLTDIT